MRQYSSSYIFNEQTPSGQPLLLGLIKEKKVGRFATSQRVNNEPGVGASAGSTGDTAALLALVPPPPLCTFARPHCHCHSTSAPSPISTWSLGLWLPASSL